MRVAAFRPNHAAPHLQGRTYARVAAADDCSGDGAVENLGTRKREDQSHRQRLRRLSLNFATMRAILAGESGEGITQRVERWLFKRMSDSMQIESLWRFNAKYDPDWRPLYAVYDARENVLPAALAVARAESFWELPVIGRFLTPTEPEPEQPTASR